MIEIQVAFIALLVTVVVALIVASLFFFPRLFVPRCLVCLQPLEGKEIEMHLVFVEEPRMGYSGICSRCAQRRQLAGRNR